MTNSNSPAINATVILRRPFDPTGDHFRGGGAPAGVMVMVLYGDYLCPYCRRIRHVLAKLRQVLGARFVYVFRHFPNERAHPGANLLACVAEASGKQGRFWEMHDWLYEQTPPIDLNTALRFASALGLDMERFQRDLPSDETKAHIDRDLSDGRQNGVTATPTVFVDGLRYDGAWDFYSMLEALERPVGARVQRSARAFASLPASGGFMLLIASAAALVCANTPLAPFYRLFMNSRLGIDGAGRTISLTVGDWFSEGLLAIFFLLVGLEIRREMTVGALSDWRAALLPSIGAAGGVVAPALIYLALNSGPAAAGWAVPTNTDVAFTLGILALLGTRIPTGLRVFVAALAVVDDILSVLTLAIFYPRDFEPTALVIAGAAVLILLALNRARIYSAWPYVLVAFIVGLFLHIGGVHAALAGVLLAAFLPTRPAPTVGPLLAQAANALAELEQAERDAMGRGDKRHTIDQEPIWDWASRNLSAASDRLLSPADRIERAVAPWSAYVILPLFAFSATGVNLSVNLSRHDAQLILLGVIIGLVIGKPLGISLASWVAIRLNIARVPDDITLRQFIGAACLCGVGDTVALLLADQAFPSGTYSAIAKIGALVGSVLAAALGTMILVMKENQVTPRLAATSTA